MKFTVNKLACAVQALAALLLLGAVKLWAPVCGKMLTLVSGKEVHMKCFYTGQTAVVLAVIMLAVALLGFFAKQDQKKFLLVNAVAAVLLFMVFTSIIGVCASPDMRCNVTALWAKILAAVNLAASLLCFIASKEGQIPN